MNWKEMFLDSKGKVSFLRVISFLIVLIASFGFIYSILTVFAEGLLYSTGLLTAVLGVKGFSKTIEEKKNG